MVANHYKIVLDSFDLLAQWEDDLSRPSSWCGVWLFWRGHPESSPVQLANFH